MIVLAKIRDIDMIEKLVSAIQKSQTNENIFISPSSIAIALSMTYNGARGKTQNAMAKTLNF
ncbi:MAG: hypothetical protein F6K48_25170 [Okeania sp. SIO3H1]|nr:hypothetical protein [Okeania sp. SIO3H1]NET24357.1 hypothetical protein [Okeania sp. SIO1I7]